MVKAPKRLWWAQYGCRLPTIEVETTMASNHGGHEHSVPSLKLITTNRVWRRLRRLPLVSLMLYVTAKVVLTHDDCLHHAPNSFHPPPSWAVGASPTNTKIVSDLYPSWDIQQPTWVKVRPPHCVGKHKHSHPSRPFGLSTTLRPRPPISINHLESLTFFGAT